MFTLTIFGFGPENGSTKGTLGMKFEPERLVFGGVASAMVNAWLKGKARQPQTKKLLTAQQK